MPSFASSRRRIALAAGALALLIAPSSAHAFGSSWDPLIGLKAVDGASWIRAYSTDTVPSTVFAATEGGGIYRSVNNGITWSDFSSGLTTPGARTVRAISTTPAGFFAGTQEGVFKANGSNWVPAGQGSGPGKLSLSVQALLPLGTNLLAGTFAGGVYRSPDGGQSWGPPAAGNGMPAGETVWSLQSFGPMVLAGTSSGIYRSLDGGVSWTLSGDGIPPGVTAFRVFVDSGAPNVWYAGTGDGVYRSVNAGITWGSISDGLPGGGAGAVRDLKSFVAPGGTRLYAATGNGVYSAITRLGVSPGDVSWTRVTTTGLGSNLIVWALSDFLTPPGSLLAGTQSDGGYGLTFVSPISVQSPQIDASSKVGQTLDASSGTWIGTGNFAYGFAWQRCQTQDANCSDIPGATDSEYVASESDFGLWLRVRVTARGPVPSFSFPAPAASASVRVGAKLGSLPGDTTTSAPQVTIDAPGDSSLPTVGNVARVNVRTTMPNQTFNPGATLPFSYTWLRCDENYANCVEIAGAPNAATYTLREEDAGMRVKAQVTGANIFGALTLTSANTTNLVIPGAAANTVAPTLLGSATIGESLVGGVGAWKSPTTTYERQWQVCEADGSGCNSIINASGPSYTVRALDVGKRLRMRVTADVNESYKLPAAVEAYTPLTDVVPPLGGSEQPGGGGEQPGGQPGGGEQPGGGPQGGGSQPGGGVPRRAVADHVKPRLSGTSITRGSFKAGAKGVQLRFRLSERGTLRLAVVKPAKRRGKPGKTVGTLVAKVSRAGAGHVAFNGRIGRKTLAAGGYKLVVTPVDAAGNRGRAVTLAFRIVRR